MSNGRFEHGETDRAKVTTDHRSKAADEESNGADGELGTAFSETT